MTEKKMWLEQEITCKPLDTYNDILAFLQDPPPWRTLCVELKPHSENSIRNIEINPHFGETLLEIPQTFCHYVNPETEEVRPVRREERKRIPKTLVCHDMANGYHDDSFIDGTGEYDAYTFYNWGGIDIFCYFSHHLITIPPLGWINVGHAHGVKVIGTVITEWSDGVVFWDKILNSETEMQNFVNALVTIAKTLKFDGWLLNIENKIAKPETLLEFVRDLHTSLHQELEDPVLIWYDSVTIEGHLTWQNELNEKNKAFFDVVDGFFTNYSWTEKNVESSAKIAGDRLTDVFIGIDVWGRNFYGGGQFNTQEAIQVAHDYGCSLAIFAPAWSHEAMYEDKTDVNYVTDSDDLNKLETFFLRERALWGSIWPYLNTNLPCTLPFQTSFCKGNGKKRRLYGEVICPRPWYNLRHMQYQPNSSHGPHGYFLSTVDNIKNLSLHGLLKDKSTTMKYRRSLEASKLEILTAKSREHLTNLNLDNTVDVANDEDKKEHTNEIDDEKKTPDSKTTFKSYFRHLFRMKASKPQEHSGTEQAVAKLTESDADTSSSHVKSQSAMGRSMVQVSVNLRIGHVGKTRYALAYVPNELECLEPFYEDSFTGGSCIKVNPSDQVSPEHRLIRIFHCDFHCDKTLIACVVTKTLVGHEDQFLNIKLFMTDREGKDVKVVLVGHHIPQAQSHTTQKSADVMLVYPYGSPSDPEFRDVQRYMLWNESGFYIPVENSFGWKVRYYAIDMEGARVTSINCRTGLNEGPILLGYFGLCSRNEDALLNKNTHVNRPYLLTENLHILQRIVGHRIDYCTLRYLLREYKLQTLPSMVEVSELVCAGGGIVGATVAAALQFFAASQCLLQEPWPTQASVKNGSSFDYIVVGGGTAGSVVAARLSELSDATVLLIEAGGDPPQESIVPGFKDTMKGSQYDWNFTTVNDFTSSQALRDGSQRQPRGKMLGGSGSINDMVYARGFPADYNEWATIVGDEWNWCNVIEYFKKTEHLTDERIINDPELRELHGHGGEIEVTGSNKSSHTTDMFLEAFHELGFEIVKDMTSSKVIGAGRFSHTIKEGKRDSSLTALLNKANDRKNLFVLKHALVTQIIIEDNVAKGVKVIENDNEYHYFAEKEIVISAGTFNTAKLLLLSGIGPKAHLDEVGIELVEDLPVGDNLHDHVMVLTYLAAENGTCHSNPRMQYMDTIKYLYDGSGSLSWTTDIGAYISLNADTKNIPEFAIYPTCMSLGSDFYEGCMTVLGFKPHICAKLDEENKFNEILSLAVVNLKPKSRGKVRLLSKDPLDEPLIYSGTFSDLDDLAGFPDAMKIAWSLADTTYFKAKNAYVVDLHIDGCEGLVDMELQRCRAKAMATSAWHAVGTAAMGTVVDSKLRVNGVQRLRIADASVMPKVIRGNTNAPVVMIAEKAADYIKDSYYETKV
ncbi:uncharacterized protein [Epargyreus clarus]|uniref:uncharacterized protein n=1 Tax=Epargyreus clarus TaxID=520877 RepID=UPI003C2CA220